MVGAVDCGTSKFKNEGGLLPMRARLWATSIAAPCLLGLLWANGESWDTVLRDSNTGVLVPTRRTPVRVEREELQITLLDNQWRSYYNLREPYGFRVQATYYLHNPTSQPQRLAVAFPIPYPALFTETPVVLDDRPLEWRYFDPYDVFRWHRKELAEHLNKWLGKRPHLRAAIDQAYTWWRADRSRSRTSTYRFVKQPAHYEDDRPIYAFPKEAVSKQQLRRAIDELSGRQTSQATIDDAEYGSGSGRSWYLDQLWTIYLFAQGEHELVSESAIRFLSFIGYTPSLAKQWAISHNFLEPLSSSLHAPYKGEFDWWITPEPWEVSVLMFEFSLAPNTRAQLTVRYAHPVGIQYLRSGIDPELHTNHRYDIAEPFWHFTYVLKIRPTWAYFGPIDVTFRIPESMRLRASPRLAFARRDEAGWRIYRATLQPYRQNLYAVVAPELYFRPRLELNPQEVVTLRYLEPGRLYAPVRMLTRLRLHGERVFYDIKASATTINLSTRIGGRVVPIQLQVGSRKARVDGREVLLSAPVKIRDNRAWIPVRALAELLSTPQRKVFVEYSYRQGSANIYIDYR